MADDKKSDSSQPSFPAPEVIDDWDSLPLDPDGDDWDDLSSPLAAPIPPAADPPAGAKLPPGAAPPPDSGQIFALLGADNEFETEDFGDQALDADSDLDDSALLPADEMSKFELPSALGPGDSLAPDEQLDFDLLMSAVQEAGSAPDGAGAEPAGESPNDPASVSMMEKIEAELDDLPTKKVELDIEGIFLEDHDPPPVEEEELPPGPEPGAEAAPPAAPIVPDEPPAPQKIPKLKLLMVLAPALLLICGLGFAVYKLFFSSSATEGGPDSLVVDLAVPPREPQPGSLDLGAFYVNFPGDRGETIMEMTVVLHYKDLPNRAAIEARLPLVRDVIYLVAQGRGSQVIANGEAQRLLRQMAAEQANAALGGQHIDYVQISQIRILQ